ncbi:hypothetical protein [Salinifilum ghardaiensis]
MSGGGIAGLPAACALSRDVGTASRLLLDRAEGLRRLPAKCGRVVVERAVALCSAG